MSMPELFWNASMEELKAGYTQDPDHYICLLCGKKVEKGMVYPAGQAFYTAEKFMRLHVEKEHQSVFEYLIRMDKKVTGLSDHQSNLLRLFYQGKSDAEIQKDLGIGSSSTIRNHRFVLKEKERQAKIFLVLMELLKDKNKKLTGCLPPPKTARMVDDRYNVTEEEHQKILKTYFPEGTQGRLKSFDMKQKSKLVILREIAKRFEANRIYSEKEVNEVLKTAFDDFATLRRYLIEYGFMDRKDDGSQYWLKRDPDRKEDKNVERRKELKQQYREMKAEAGVYQIKNVKNQKVFLVATPNLKTMNGRHIELNSGNHRNKELQADWNHFGEGAFVFEVLEVLEEKEGSFFDRKEELKKLEKKWLEKLKPYGERGYHKQKPE